MSTGMTQIRIDALDTLFFRDGKPFTMGSETWADALFPPSPSVVYGALRSVYFGENLKDLPLANTESDPTRDLQIHAMALRKGGKWLFPLPADYVADSTTHKDDYKGILLQCQEADFVSSCPPGINSVFAAQNEQSVKTESQGFLDGDTFSAYLKAPPPIVSYTTLKEHSTPEPKIGIARNRLTRAVKEGYLYRVDMRRLEPVRTFGKPLSAPLSLYVQFSGLPIADQGVLRFGGEGKLAAYETCEAELPAAPSLQGKRVKLYLATPAIFKHGWLPSWIDPTSLQVGGPYQHLGLTLETALLGKPLNIGGFDMKAGEPKPMRQAVPAGSVYLFRCQGDVNNAAAAFHQRCLSDDDMAKQGFGLVYAGGVQQ